MGSDTVVNVEEVRCVVDEVEERGGGRSASRNAVSSGLASDEMVDGV